MLRISVPGVLSSRFLIRLSIVLCMHVSDSVSVSVSVKTCRASSNLPKKFRGKLEAKVRSVGAGYTDRDSTFLSCTHVNDNVNYLNMIAKWS